MSNAAGHLTQGTQALLLHDRLLRLPQIVVCLLQGCIQLGLMRGQRNVFVQLAEKVAFAAAEASRFASSGHKDTKDLAFHQERRRYQRTQTRGSKLLRERHHHTGNIRLVEELPEYALAQSVCINGNLSMLGEGQVQSKFPASHADMDDIQRSAYRVIVADTAEIKSEILLQATERHLIDTVEVLSPADRTSLMGEIVTETSIAFPSFRIRVVSR